MRLPNVVAPATTEQQVPRNATDELPPPYESVQADPQIPRSRVRTWEVVGACESWDPRTSTTLYPKYSNDANFLASMAKEQFTLPPSLYLDIKGTHRQPSKNNPKDVSIVTDFNFRIELTSYLLCGATNLYRTGGSKGIVDDPEQVGNLDFWCEKYTSDPADVKRIQLKKEIWLQTSLKGRIKSLIRDTNYGGDIEVTTATQDDGINVYSPGFINRWRTSWHIYMWFYITPLWIITWPYLKYMTSNHGTLTAKFTTRPGSEEEFYESWKESIKRAAIGRQRGTLHDSYRRRTEEINAAGVRTGIPAPVGLVDAFAVAGALGLSRAEIGTLCDRIRYSSWGGS